MRAKRTHQISIYETFAEHAIGQELKALSEWLDRHIEALDWVEKDIQRKGVKDTGRSGMSIEAILRCGLLKQHRQWTYEELAFHLTDSALQSVIALIRGETWEYINQALVKDALAIRIETLRQARIDSTVTETLIHKPWDSSLLGDAKQVLERLMIEACEHDPQLWYTCYRRVIKKQIMAIRNCKLRHLRPRWYLLVALPSRL